MKAETQLKLMAVKYRKLEEEKMAEQRRLMEVVEDQAETIRKLKAVLAERDELVRKGREEALRTQKGLERQLTAEMDCANELRVRLEKARESLDEVNMSYAELSTHWKVKRELMSDLDSKVHKTKVGYEARIAALKDESERLRREAECLGKRLRKVDNFSQQYDVKKREHSKIMEYEARLKSGAERVAEAYRIQ